MAHQIVRQCQVTIHQKQIIHHLYWQVTLMNELMHLCMALEYAKITNAIYYQIQVHS